MHLSVRAIGILIIVMELESLKALFTQRFIQGHIHSQQVALRMSQGLYVSI